MLSRAPALGKELGWDRALESEIILPGRESDTYPDGIPQMHLEFEGW